MMNKVCLTALALVGCAIGCEARAATLTVTYQSEPAGAALFQDGQLMGYAPVTLRYKLTRDDTQHGQKLLRGTSVKWASGASAEISSLTVDLRAAGKNQQFMFQRPDSFPGRAADVQIAIEMERLALERRQMAINNIQAYIENQRRSYEQMQRSIQRSTPAPSFCSSTVIGNIITTNCR